MPTSDTAKRQRTTRANSTRLRQQSILSFRTTKAGLKPSDGIKDDKRARSEPVDVVVDNDAVSSSTLEPSEEGETGLHAGGVLDGQTVAKEETEEELAQRILKERALALPESRIKSYWAGKERERKAPRVHQEGMGIRERVLREFDMSSRFGPSAGITRTGRWHRAHDLGMDPPIEVLSVLLKEMKEAANMSTNDRDMQRSIIDDLTLSNRVKAADGMTEV